MTTKPMMKCGHAANAESTAPDGKRVPSCAICGVIAQLVTPVLEGRSAQCAYFGKKHKQAGLRGGCECQKCRERPDHICRCVVPSSTDLAFFAYRGPGTTHYRGEAPHDEYYCGCMGWD